MTVRSKDVKPFMQRRRNQYLEELVSYWNRPRWRNRSDTKLENIRGHLATQVCVQAAFIVLYFVLGSSNPFHVVALGLALVMYLFAHLSPRGFVRSYGRVKWFFRRSEYKKSVLKRILSRHTTLASDLARTENSYGQAMHELDKQVALGSLKAVEQTLEDLYQLELSGESVEKTAPVLRSQQHYEQIDEEIQGSVGALRKELGLQE